MPKRALITGISGQDGSYLAELLLSKGYEVYGLKRRTSTNSDERIAHLLPEIRIIDGDMTDSGSLLRATQKCQPDEVYNLAAQSFVQTSFGQPELTAEVTGLGVLRMLEAVRAVAPKARFYQASTSEMFGGHPPPQSDETPFYPKSPYGVAKLYGHWMVVNYRESYDMFACAGILFNHECVTSETPVIIKKNGMIDIVPIGDVVPHRTNPKHGTKYTTVPSEAFEVWDNGKWSKVTCMTATWNRKDSKKVVSIEGRGAVFSATIDHVCFDKNKSEVKAGDLYGGGSLALVEPPPPTGTIEMLETEAWLLGVLAGDGSITRDGKVRLTNTDESLLQSGAECWYHLTGMKCKRWEGKSGFDGSLIPAINMHSKKYYGEMLREELYTRDGKKKVPFRVLNAKPEVQMAFLRGYNEADGLKAGHCSYEFKSFKTDSASLAAGLYWLSETCLLQRAIICVEHRDDSVCYQINLNSPSKAGLKGDHLVRPLDEIVKVSDREYEGWLFDLATESGTFHAGIGKGWIHNSPRRGFEFVTQKIARGAASIKLGMSSTLSLGNLEARRDWGHAKDFVEAMWLMLQQETPEDYVIATGEAHTVREFVDLAFRRLGMSYEDHVVVDRKFFRPAEVNYLLGDCSKATRKMGWKPKVSFDELVFEMVDHAYAHPEEWVEKHKTLSEEKIA